MVNLEITRQTRIIKLRPQERIIKYLIEHKEPVSILRASGAVVVDYKNAHKAVNELESRKIIIGKRIGNANLIRINLIPNQGIYNVESKRREEFLVKHPKLRILTKYIEEESYPFLIVLVFGSYAKGEEKAGSDIDLCIISDNKDKVNEICNKFNILSLKLEIQEFTTKEFTSMIEKKQNNLGNEIVKNNVLLYGIENYYNLISKWMKNE